MIRICFPRLPYNEGGIDSDMAKAISILLEQDIVVEDHYTDGYGTPPDDPYYDSRGEAIEIYYNKAACPADMQQILAKVREANWGRVLPTTFAIENFELIVRKRDG